MLQRFRISLDSPAADFALLRLRQAQAPGGQHNARGQAEDIPLEWSRVGFVKIMEIKQQLTLRGCVEAEVQYVGITHS